MGPSMGIDGEAGSVVTTAKWSTLQWGRRWASTERPHERPVGPAQGRASMGLSSDITSDPPRDTTPDPLDACSAPRPRQLWVLALALTHASPGPAGVAPHQVVRED